MPSVPEDAEEEVMYDALGNLTAKRRPRRQFKPIVFLGLRHPDPDTAWCALSPLERLMTWPARCNCWAVDVSIDGGHGWWLGMRASFSGNF